MKEVLRRITTGYAIGIVRGIPKDAITQTVSALLEGGVDSIEVTFDHSSIEGREETLEKIRMVKQLYGSTVNIGAGTVLSAREAVLAAEAGADYMISPNVNPEVIKTTKAMGKISIPGAFTPSEVCAAYDMGADIVKLFPAGSIGVEYIRALKAPLPHVPLCATGGVTVENVKEYLDAGVACFGIGANLVSAKDISAGDFNSITKKAAAYRQAIDRYCGESR